MGGDKLGQIDFGEMPERFRWVQILHQGGVAELKWLDREGGVTGAVDAGVAPVGILVLFMVGAGGRIATAHALAMVFRHGAMILAGMGVCVHAIDRHAQHEHEEEPGKEFDGDESAHNKLWALYPVAVNYVNMHNVVQVGSLQWLMQKPLDICPVAH